MKDILIITIEALVYATIVAVIETLLFNHMHKSLIILVFLSSYIDLSVQKLKEEK